MKTNTLSVLGGSGDLVKRLTMGIRGVAMWILGGINLLPDPPSRIWGCGYGVGFMVYRVYMGFVYEFALTLLRWDHDLGQLIRNLLSERPPTPNANKYCTQGSPSEHWVSQKV